MSGQVEPSDRLAASIAGGGELVREGRAAFKAGQYARSEEIFMQALAAGANEAECRIHLARIYNLESNWEKALEQWQWLRAREPGRVEPELQVARAQYRLSRYAEAAVGFKAVLALEPSHSEARERLDQIEARHEAAASAKDRSAVQLDEGRAAFKAGDYVRSEEAFTRALAIGANEAECRIHLARIYNLGSNWEKALEQWQWLRAREPGRVEPELQVARAQYRLSRYVEAAVGFKAVLALEPEHAEGRKTLKSIVEALLSSEVRDDSAGAMEEMAQILDDVGEDVLAEQLRSRISRVVSLTSDTRRLMRILRQIDQLQARVPAVPQELVAEFYALLNRAIEEASDDDWLQQFSAHEPVRNNKYVLFLLALTAGDFLNPAPGQQDSLVAAAKECFGSPEVALGILCSAGCHKWASEFIFAMSISLWTSPHPSAFTKVIVDEDGQLGAALKGRLSASYRGGLPTTAPFVASLVLLAMMPRPASHDVACLKAFSSAVAKCPEPTRIGLRNLAAAFEFVKLAHTRNGRLEAFSLLRDGMQDASGLPFALGYLVIESLRQLKLNSAAFRLLMEYAEQDDAGRTLGSLTSRAAAHFEANEYADCMSVVLAALIEVRAATPGDMQCALAIEVAEIAAKVGARDLAQGFVEALAKGRPEPRVGARMVAVLERVGEQQGALSLCTSQLARTPFDWQLSAAWLRIARRLPVSPDRAAFLASLGDFRKYLDAENARQAEGFIAYLNRKSELSAEGRTARFGNLSQAAPLLGQLEGTDLGRNSAALAFAPSVSGMSDPRSATLSGLLGRNVSRDLSEVTIAVLSCNRIHLTLRLLRSIQAVYPDFGGQVAIWDNASSPAQRRLLEKGLSGLSVRVQVHWNDTNLGVGPARNALARRIQTPWFLSLDNDMYFFRDAAESLAVTVLSTGAKFVNLPFINDVDGRRFGWGKNWELRSSGAKTYIEHSNAIVSADPCDDSMAAFCFTNRVSGGAALYYRDAFLAMGGFDERLVVGYEDTEFSLRVVREGLLIANAGVVSLMHGHLGASNRHDLEAERKRFSTSTLLNSSQAFARQHGIQIGQSDVAQASSVNVSRHDRKEIFFTAGGEGIDASGTTDISILVSSADQAGQALTTQIVQLFEKKAEVKVFFFEEFGSAARAPVSLLFADVVIGIAAPQSAARYQDSVLEMFDPRLVAAAAGRLDVGLVSLSPAADRDAALIEATWKKQGFHVDRLAEHAAPPEGGGEPIVSQVEHFIESAIARRLKTPETAAAEDNVRTATHMASKMPPAAQVDAKTALAEAEKLVAAKRDLPAIDILKSISGERDLLARKLRALGIATHRLKRWDESSSAFAQLRELRQLSQGEAERYASALAQTGARDNRIDEIGRLCARFPDNFQLVSQRAKLMREKDADTAIQELVVWARAHSGDARPWTLLVSMALQNWERGRVVGLVKEYLASGCSDERPLIEFFQNSAEGNDLLRLRRVAFKRWPLASALRTPWINAGIRRYGPPFEARVGRRILLAMREERADVAGTVQMLTNARMLDSALKLAREAEWQASHLSVLTTLCRRALAIGRVQEAKSLMLRAYGACDASDVKKAVAGIVRECDQLSAEWSELTLRHPTALDVPITGQGGTKYRSMAGVFAHAMLVDRRNRVESAGHGKVRILHVTNGLNMGGSERQLANTIRLLGGEPGRFDQHILKLRSDSERNDDFFGQTLGRHVSSVRHIDEFGLSPQEIAEAALEHLKSPNWDTLVKLRRFRLFLAAFRQLSPSVVFFWSPEVIAALAACHAGVDRVIFRAGSIAPLARPSVTEAQRTEFTFMKELYSELVQDERVRLVTNSARALATFVDTMGWKSARCQVFYNVFEPPIDSGATGGRTSAGGSANRAVIGGVFRVSSEKRPFLWLNAVDEQLKRNPSHVALLAGDGAMLGDLRRSVEARGLRDRVRLAGRMGPDAVADVYRQFDVLLLTSEYEGLPNVVLEAQWAGVPVVSSDVGGAGEAMMPGTTGLLVDGNDPRAFQSAINRVLTWKRGPAFTRACREHIKSRFSERAVAAQLATLLGPS